MIKRVQLPIQIKCPLVYDQQILLRLQMKSKYPSPTESYSGFNYIDSAFNWPTDLNTGIELSILIDECIEITENEPLYSGNF